MLRISSFLGILSVHTCSVVRSEKNRFHIFPSLFSRRGCSRPVLSAAGGEFQHPVLYCLGWGLDLLGYYSSSSFTRLLAKQRAHSLNTQKMHIESLRHTLLLCFCRSSSACSSVFACSARSVNLCSKQVLFMPRRSKHLATPQILSDICSAAFLFIASSQNEMALPHRSD